MKKIPDSLIEKARKFLDRGTSLERFKRIIKMNPGGWWIPLHTGAGLRFQEWMRKQTECKNWQTYDFKNGWYKLIELAVMGKVQ